MSAQTIPQILSCLTLGRYTAAVEDGELRIRGPQPLAGPLPASIDARRAELVAYLADNCGGTWPSRNPPIREPRAHAAARETREFLARSSARRERAA